MRDAFHEQLDSITTQLVDMTRLAGSAMARATTALLDADLTVGTESTLAAHIQAIQALIKERGTPVGIEELLPSDAVVPFSGISVAELREFIGQEGLIPG